MLNDLILKLIIFPTQSIIGSKWKMMAEKKTSSSFEVKNQYYQAGGIETYRKENSDV